MAADTFSTSGRIQLQGTGNNNLTWGQIADNQLQNLEAMITGDNGFAGGTGGISLTGLATYTLTANNGTSDQARQQLYPFVGNLSAPCTVTMPGVVKMGQALNATSGGQNVILTTGGAGATLTLEPGGNWVYYYCDGTNVIRVSQDLLGPWSGTTTNDNAAAGDVGEYLSATTPTGQAISSGSITAPVQLALTPGDWDVWGSIAVAPSGNSLGGQLGVSTSATAFMSWPGGGTTLIENPGVATVQQLWTGTARFSLATNTTLFTVANMFFTGTASARGFIAARRRR